jgi:hypothetical protein
VIAPTYPKRPPFFAGKFCRLMTKVALANDLGAGSVCLLMVVAHQEDAAGYRGPVTYWNDQLKPLIGVRTDHALITTRKKAVEAGWLHYEPGGKGVAGRYWVVIPPRYRDLDAGSTAERPGEYGPVSPSLNDRDGEGIATGIVQGKPVSPSPNDRDTHNHSSLPQEEEEKNPPYPPQAGGDSKTPPPTTPAPTPGKPKKPPQRPEAVPLPAALDAPAFRGVWADWLADRKARGKPVTELAAKQQLAALESLGPVAAAECVRESIRNGWAGLFPNKHQPGQRPRSPPLTAAEREEKDLLRYLSDDGGSDP